MRTLADLPLLLSVLSIPLLWSVRARGQCALEQSPDSLLGNGSAIRIAVDHTTEAPVAIWNDPTDGIVYRRFLGPKWGRAVKVDTGGSLPPATADGIDHVLDEYGRLRIALVHESGVFHTRQGDGWTTPEKIVDVAMDGIEWHNVSVRFERDDTARAHVLFWTEIGGRRSYHA